MKDLHEEGETLLHPYKRSPDGTHPEYQTTRTLNALRDYVTHGGRLVYLGGNGFYWRVGRNESLPEVLEVRRAEGGTRAWAAEPGELTITRRTGPTAGYGAENGRDPQCSSESDSARKVRGKRRITTHATIV